LDIGVEKALSYYLLTIDCLLASFSYYRIIGKTTLRFFSLMLKALFASIAMLLKNSGFIAQKIIVMPT
jgi:hypothetical protein